MSDATTAMIIAENSRRLALRIFLALLALDAIPCMRQRIKTLESNLLAAVVTLAERFRRLVEAAQRLIDMPEETSLLACKEKRLFALHRVRALIGHVERVGAQVAVGCLLA